MQMDGFRARLAEIVAAEGQSEVARKAGVDQSTVCRMLRRERLGRLDTVMRIVRAYPELGRFFLPQDIPN